MRSETRVRLLIGLVVALVTAVVLAFTFGGVTTGIGVAVIAVLGPTICYYRYIDSQPLSLHPRRRSS